MSLGHCSCPDCGTTLRVRDRSFIGRQIDCPDCQAKLVITLNDERTLVAERPKQDASDKKPKLQRLAIPAPQVGSAVGKKLGEIIHSPLVLAWSLAIGLTAFAAILMLRPAVRLRTPTKDQSQPVATVPADATPSKDPQEAVAVNPQTPSSAPVNQPSPSETVVDATPVVTEPPVTIPAEKPENVVDVPVVKPEVTPKVVPLVPKKIDVEGLLKQPFEKVSTKMPISREDVIELVEGMLGAPIRYDRAELGEKNLERKMSIELENTTVGGVLKVLLDSAGWEYIVEDNGIRLKPRQVADTIK